MRFSNPPIVSGCPTIQGYSDTIYVPIRPTYSRAWSHRTASTSDTSHKIRDTGTTDWQAMNQVFPPSPPPQVWSFARIAYRTHEKHLTDIYWFIIRMQLWNSQMEKLHRARCGSVVWHSFYALCGRSPHQHLNVLTNWKALSISLFQCLWNSISSPPPFTIDGEGTCWEFQPSYNLLFLISSPILKLSVGPILHYHIRINSV